MMDLMPLPTYPSGYLAPDGTFTHADYYDHCNVAQGIAQDKQLTGQEAWNIGEDILLFNGYMVFRARSVQKQVYGRDKKILWITEDQQKWIRSNKDRFTQMQLADIQMILKDFGGLREFNEVKV